MTSSSFQHAQTIWARTLVQTLHAAGVTHFVVSPGSRSTPLVKALQDASLPFDVIIDERSAAFFALGRAKWTGQPSALVCTSGSAAAHYLPAIIEADQGHTPLIVLSADRPPELQFNGAFQTIEQRNLFGSKVRWFEDLGVADASADALLGLRRKCAQAVGLCQHPTPGPVHLNVPARKPLEPSADADAATRTSATLASPGSYETVTSSTSFEVTRHFRSVASLDDAACTAIARVFEGAQRPALVLGPCTPKTAATREAIAEFLSASGWPLIAEATSNARFGVAVSATPGIAPDTPLVFDAFDLCLRASLGASATAAPLASMAPASERGAPFVPDAVLQIGGVPTSASLLALTRDVPRVVVAEHHWPDPTNRATVIARAEPSRALSQLASKVPKAAASYRDAVSRANAAAWEAVCTHSAVPAADRHPTPTDPIFEHEGQCVAALGRSLLADDLVVLGNSLPLRVFDTFVAARRERLHCLSQRGANGIDGGIAVACGAASAHTGHTVLLLGDVAFLHDVGSLKVAWDLKPSLTIVVLNNRGGRLFEQLPIARAGSANKQAANTQRVDEAGADDPAMAPWITPHDVELYRLGHAYRLVSYRVGSKEELEIALGHARTSKLPSLIEVMVTPSGTSNTMPLLVQSVRAGLKAAFG